jgi:ATP-dependent DNA helicase RecQ
MNQNALEHLGLPPEQFAHITGRQRTRLIDFLLRWEQYEAALACLESVLASDPERVGLLDAKTKALLGLDEVDAALEVAQARNRMSSSLSSQALLARVHLARGDVPAALNIAHHLTAERPDRITAWDLLAAAHLAASDLDAAHSALHHLSQLWPHSRTYLLGMLAFYQAQGDYVTASGYAVRLQRTVAEGESLPATTLRRLRDYFRDSGEINRAEEMEAELHALGQDEHGELDAVLAGVLKTPKDRRTRPTDRSVSTAPVAIEDLSEPLPQPEAIPVSDRERQRVEEAVRRFFGFKDLLPGQAETMAAVLRRQDVLTILPTGGGKSLCYQVPALLDDTGTTLVISPLIALMKDQVDSLPPLARQRATTVTSLLEGDELNRRVRNVAAGRYRLVYAAPERLRQPPFLHALRRCGVNRLVIDEAHCVSVWGHDFRPDYLTISQARRALGDPPLLAMTATAPPRVRRDILQRLGRQEGETERMSTGQASEMAVVAAEVHRPNLFLAAVRAQNADDKLRHLLSLCEAATGSGIIYAGTRARCEQIAALLRGRGISTAYYHAGMDDRAAVQDAFMSGQVQVVVATIAFGMGIDKADIRFIIHLQLPSSLEAYYQEVGRAGRDGLPAHCVLIYSTSDRATLTRRAKQDALSTEFLRRVYAAVKGRLGDTSPGRVAMDDLMRDIEAPETSVRVALSTLEQAGLLRRHQDVARTAVVRLMEAQRDQPREGEDPAWSAFISAARLKPRQPLPLDLIDVARKAGQDPITIEERVLAWADAGQLGYRPAGRDLLLELLPPRADATARVEALIDRYATIQVQRVDEIAAYAATHRCRHGHINTYLSGRPMAACRSCDNCQPDSSLIKSAATFRLPSDADQLLAILRCVADAPWSWGSVSLRNILRGSSRAPEKGRPSPEWVALAYRSEAAVDELLDRLVAADLLRRRPLDHGGVVLDLTPSGRTALKNPTRLPSLATRPPTSADAPIEPKQDTKQIGPVDETLFQRLRTWRREVARAAGVPPFVVAHDTVLQRIAAARPKNEAELAEIKGIGPRKLSQYGPAILALVNREDEPASG